MEARAQDTDTRETAPTELPDAVRAATDFAAAYERYATGLRPVLLDLVADDDKANRITEAAFVAAFQALAAGAPGAPSPSNATVASPALTAVGPCPNLGYADDP